MGRVRIVLKSKKRPPGVCRGNIRVVKSVWWRLHDGEMEMGIGVCGGEGLFCWLAFDEGEVSMEERGNARL